MSAIEDDTCDEQTYLIGGRRQLVLDQPLGLFRGPNTLHNFASSFTRAQLFAAHKLDADLHKKRSFFAGSRDLPQDELFDPDLMVALPHGERLSVLVPELNLLRQGGFSGHAGLSGLNEVFYQDDVATMLQLRSRRASSAANAIPIPTKRVFPAPFISERAPGDAGCADGAAIRAQTRGGPRWKRDNGRGRPKYRAADDFELG
ncbi:hypothetical protein HF325_000159 [Metschnikowia pulcherrima]|uniref:Uncharacterized protein n=1 Tax=Metschnikowia pulcherrima TaxID=27326 RepID=A0A8H7GXT9_9ASCO|nr:hypothetical protein HF325_000159 [Metschnikowia pulcherrima]